MAHFVPVLLTLIVAIDCIGSVPVYLTCVRNFPEHMQRSFAIYSVIVAAILLLVVIFLGVFLIEQLELWGGRYQIINGALLFVLAAIKIFGHFKPSINFGVSNQKTTTKHILPFVTTSIATPSVIIVILLLAESHTASVVDLSAIIALLLLAILLTLACLLNANTIYKTIGNSGANMVSEMMSIVVAVIAIDAVLCGFDAS